MNQDSETQDDSWGLWQINRIFHFDTFGTPEELVIPERNAAAAYQLYLGRNKGFQDWTVYKNGTYRNFLPEVQAAAQEMGIG